MIMKSIFFKINVIIFHLLFLFIITIYLFSCRSEDKNKADVVAQVNMAQITNSELESSLSPSISIEVKQALKRKLMEKWIEEEIFYQAALEDGISLSEDEERMVKDYARHLIIQRYLGEKINRNYRILDQEIEDYYNKHREEFKWDSDYAQIIHLVMENEDKTINNEIRKSKNLTDVIKNNFFDQQSTDTRPIGDLGYIRLDELPSRLERSIRRMKTGNIGGPIKTELGNHYVQLLDFQKSGSQKDLDVVREEIIFNLKLQKRNAEIEKLKQNLRPNFTIQTDVAKLMQY